MERLTTLSDNELVYQYTVEDPTVYRTDHRMSKVRATALADVLKGERVSDMRQASDQPH